METGKYGLTNEEQLQREKWDRYSMEKTAKWKVKMEIAKNLKQMGANTDFISKATGLTEEGINQL